jgi:hypothetical protein
MADEPLGSNQQNAVFKDPFTGTTPTGPVRTAPPGTPVDEENPRRWGMVAKWLLMSFLFLLIAAAIGWYYW